jgi:hypothetical protein
LLFVALDPAVKEFLRQVGLGAQRVGHKAAAAAIATGLDSLAGVGEHIAKTIRKSQKAAERMAKTGDRYESPFEDYRRNPEEETDE